MQQKQKHASSLNEQGFQQNQLSKDDKPQTPLNKGQKRKNYDVTESKSQNSQENSTINFIMINKANFNMPPPRLFNIDLSNENSNCSSDLSNINQSRSMAPQQQVNQNCTTTATKDYYSTRSINHTPVNSIGQAPQQIEKLKTQLAQAKRKASQSRSKSRGHASMKSSSYKYNAKLNNIVQEKAEHQASQKQHKLNALYSQNNITMTDKSQSINNQGKTLSRSSSHTMFQQAINQNEKCTNIKVHGRFRPFNKVENELCGNGLGNDCCLHPDAKTVVLIPDNLVYTLDRIFTPTATQEEVYECVGRETISDVINGYNGTIFAYGQTGSGKTYTMFGNIYDSYLKGLIPRSIEDIFKHIEKTEMEIDFVLTCSMLEIYKETLYDLLSSQRADLKIKESPQRGIYVEGLSQMNVVSEAELLQILEMGEQARKVAATRINQYSSRSHTIFMLEIKQLFPNDTEKKGKLNLVDLAGSEKVGKTGAIGDILEEAKKINLSLSCLGNVIHNLTTNSDHIPYRDSKLTRILSESLGGNYKTSLIVTCSSHSSSLEETISTLKFATRAKSIKNHFKMNIKNSPEALQRIIFQLKKELLDTKAELEQLKKNYFQISEFIPSEDKIQKLPSAYDSSSIISMHKSSFKKHMAAATPNKDSASDIVIINDTSSQTSEYSNTTKCQGILNLTEDPFNKTDIISTSSIRQLTNVSSSTHHHIQQHQQNQQQQQTREIELIQQNEYLQMKLQGQEKEINSLNGILQDQKQQILKLNEENKMLCAESLNYEKVITQLKDERDAIKVKLERNNSDQNKQQIEEMKKQLEQIKEHLKWAEQKSQEYLKEKTDIMHQKFQDFIQKSFSHKQIQDLPQYLQQSYSTLPTVEAQNTIISSSNQQQNLKIDKNQERYFIELKSICTQSKIANNRLIYLMKLIEESRGSVLQSSENMPHGSLSTPSQSHQGGPLVFAITLLQYELLRISTLNQNLECNLKALELNQRRDYEKKLIRKNKNKIVKAANQNLEQILQKAITVHQCLRNRIETVEVEAVQHLESLTTEQSPERTKKSKIVRPVKRYSNDCLIKKAQVENFLKIIKEFVINECEQIYQDRTKGTSNCASEDFKNYIAQRGLSCEQQLQISFEELCNTLISTESQSKNQEKDIIKENILKSENKRMQDKILVLCQELELEQQKSKQLEEVLQELQKQLQSNKNMQQKYESSSQLLINNEIGNFKKLCQQIEVFNEIIPKIQCVELKGKSQQHNSTQLTQSNKENNLVEQQIKHKEQLGLTRSHSNANSQLLKSSSIMGFRYDYSFLEEKQQQFNNSLINTSSNLGDKSLNQ